jgi:hypothetical protein
MASLTIVSVEKHINSYPYGGNCELSSVDIVFSDGSRARIMVDDYQSCCESVDILVDTTIECGLEVVYVEYYDGALVLMGRDKIPRHIVPVCNHADECADNELHDVGIIVDETMLWPAIHLSVYV